METYYNCKTCGKPYGFGRVTLEPAECNRCDPPAPYVPEPSDFELGEIAERERIIKIFEDEYYHYIEYTPVIVKRGEPMPEPNKQHASFCEGCRVIALIKGEK